MTRGDALAGNASGPRQHYIPAALLGRFSTTAHGRARKRRIWSLQRGAGQPRECKAEEVAWARDLYTVVTDDSSEDPDTIDDIWTPVERRLPSALDVLERSSGPVDALLWGEVLVPFVAHFFVRGIDFGPRFSQRWGADEEGWTGHSGVDEFALSQSNINRARVMELQRLLSPVMRARWCVLRACGEAKFITSNLGYARFARGSIAGVAVPVSGTCAVHLEPRPRHVRVYIPIEDRWFVDVDPVEVDDGVVRRLNRRMAQFAPHEIYGASRDDVASYRRHISARRARTEELVWDDSRVLRRNQLELFRTLTGLATPPGQPQLPFGDALRLIHYPAPIIFQANPEAGTGLTDAEEADVARDEEIALENERRRLGELIGLEPGLRELHVPRGGSE